VSWLEGVRAAFDTLRTQRLRAFFVVQCTAVSVAFLIAMITIIEGMGRYVENDFVGKVVGFNTVHLRRMPEQATTRMEEERAWSRRPTLSFDDLTWLESRMEVAGTFALSASGSARVGVVGGKAFDRVRVVGASSSHFSVQGLRFVRGRAFTDREADRGTAVAVLGVDVAVKLFQRRDAVGRHVTVNGSPYRVIGVLEKRGSLLGMSLDRYVVVPAQSTINGALYRFNQADMIAFKVRDAKALAAASLEIEGLMRVRHRLAPADSNDFSVGSSDNVMAAWGRISKVLLIAAPCLVGIALIAGIVVTMNIMLVVVTERTWEIGLRKSVGARSSDIRWQFLVEAGTLSGVGGGLGVLIGIAIAALVAAVSPLPAAVAPWSIVAGIAMGVGVGVIAGVYPASRAAQLDPIAAMQRE
jgi:putative ABC transport system permease protein